jgi:RNA polymerase sigma-70 factor (ECF subfamily)
MDSSRKQPSIEAVVQEVSQPLLRYLERYVGNRAIAEDLQQETLVRVARGLPSFAGRSSIKTWAFSIASRVAADYFRHPDRRAHIVELDEAVDAIDPGREINRRVIPISTNPWRSPCCARSSRPCWASGGAGRIWSCASGAVL